MVQWSIVHGPDRLRVSRERIAFHGIISSGMLRAAQASERKPAEWEQVSPLLERALFDTSARNEQLQFWLDAARSSEMLTYVESARCARSFVLKYASRIAQQLGSTSVGAVHSCELWSLKEGHTASVWVATVGFEQREEQVQFVISVPRDGDSALELERSARQLECLRARDSSSVVPVLTVGTVRFASAKGARTLPAVATAFLPTAREIHVIPSAEGHSGLCVAVDRFMHNESAPGRIRAIESHDASRHVSDAIWAAIIRRAVRISGVDPSGNVCVPEFEINEGDWVWCGDDAVLVATSATERSWRAGVAVYALALISARAADGSRLFWNDPRRVLRVLFAATQECNRIRPPHDWWREARRIEVDELRSCGLLWSPPAEHLCQAIRALLGDNRSDEVRLCVSR